MEESQWRSQPVSTILPGLQEDDGRLHGRPCGPDRSLGQVYTHSGGFRASVLIEEIRADGCKLAILPQDPSKAPLIFDIRELQLESAGPGVAMRCQAKPVDPFFAKDGYGAVVNIKVTGTRGNPQFGLDRGHR